jgi:hypothetical protein
MAYTLFPESKFAQWREENSGCTKNKFALMENQFA